MSNSYADSKFCFGLGKRDMSNFMNVRADCDPHIALRITCAKFIQGQNKTVDLHLKKTQRKTLFFI